MRLLLTKDPAKRPTAKQALKHPYFFKDKLALDNSLQLNKLLTKKYLKIDFDYTPQPLAKFGNANEIPTVRKSENIVKAKFKYSKYYMQISSMINGPPHPAES